MRTVAWVGGLVVVAGLVFLAVAGFPGAVPILISAAALVAMIGLGGVVGGRHTPNVAPVAARDSGAPGGPPSAPDPAGAEVAGAEVAGADPAGDGPDVAPNAP
jgi:hypothetical protein